MQPTIFISHISEESEVAVALKKLIKENFPQTLNIFVSSDGESIKMGRDWLNKVLKDLRSCAAQIIICSPKSVTREWINLEAGAALCRDIPIIPACHSGMIPIKLPIPLLLRQTAKLTDIEGMKKVIGDLAEVLNVNHPNIDFTKFVTGIKEFEDRYTFWDECNLAFGIIASIDSKIIPYLHSHSYLDIDLPEKSICAIEPLIPFLRSKELLNLRRTGRNTVLAPFVPRTESRTASPNTNTDNEDSLTKDLGGVYYGCKINKLSKLDAIMASPQFKPIPSTL
jgi:TIR domain